MQIFYYVKIRFVGCKRRLQSRVVRWGWGAVFTVFAVEGEGGSRVCFIGWSPYAGDTVLSNMDWVSLYVWQEPEGLYGTMEGNRGLEDFLLQHCSPRLSSVDCLGLVQEVGYSVVWMLCALSARGKVPESDGLPVEFSLFLGYH